jgi:hypothetical protein
MKKLICKILGHKYKYNFVSFPSKCKCTRCGKKWKSINNPKYNGKNLNEEDVYIWEEVK